MRISRNHFAVLLTLIVLPLATLSTAGADIVNVEFGVNTETITQVVVSGVDSNDNNFTMTQDQPETSGTVLAKTAVLQSITLADSTILENFSFLKPTIVNASFPSSGTVEVYTNGNRITDSDIGFLDGIAEMHSDDDLASYIRVDGTSIDSEWDLQYGQAIDSTGYFIVEERNGNTDFSVTALDINGNTIGDTLAFDAPSYQWDTSIKNYFDTSGSAQTQELSVIDLNLFNTSQDIHGFSIVNSGNADFKFFFGNVSSVPEPSGGAILLTGILTIALRRQRSKMVANA